MLSGGHEYQMLYIFFQLLALYEYLLIFYSILHCINVILIYFFSTCHSGHIYERQDMWVMNKKWDVLVNLVQCKDETPLITMEI